LKIACLIVGVSAILSIPAWAADNPKSHTRDDLSGIYSCTGNDGHDGKYTATATLKLDRKNSHAHYASYAFTLQAEAYGKYLGTAVARGDIMAVTYANTSPKMKTDYGTGLATISSKNGKISFHKFYYEPEYKGGNTGTEDCTKR
jgi:hypothetical protein